MCTADGHGGNQNLQVKGGWNSAAFSVSEKVVQQLKNEKAVRNESIVPL